MNTKIIVALVIGIALIGLTGGASAGYIDTYTDITATHLTSESLLKVSGIPVEQQYEQAFIAEFTFPIFPPVDFCFNNIDIQGDSYSQYNEIDSTPTGSSVLTGINIPSAVSGTWEHWDCAMWGAGEELEVAILPQPIYEPSSLVWSSGHPKGATYPAHSIEHQSIYWP